MLINCTAHIDHLIAFGLTHGLFPTEDRFFVRNRLLDLMGLSAPEAYGDLPLSLPPTATPILEALCNVAVARDLIADSSELREQFSVRIMGLLLPPPSVVSAHFTQILQTQGAIAATDWFYDFCQASNYIQVDAISRNIRCIAPSPHGELEITINLSKPEKDPRDIAAALNAPQISYPACMLCPENIGYAGRPGYPARQNLRALPLCLAGEDWYFQYSPYLYYPEHCILLNASHQPMSISRRTFDLLMDFLQHFPHYCIGSNADLPIVGGSILSHDHFQGGRYTFPMEKAPVYAQGTHSDYPDVSISLLHWPMTCIRLSGNHPETLTALADHLLSVWRDYSDPSVDVLAHTGDIPHNTITPIARRQGECYTLDLVLRNNRTTDAYPLGIFHPHDDLHHIKRENIGLIEVMGLFILPGRLCEELTTLCGYLTGKYPLQTPDSDDPMSKHFSWISSLVEKHGTHLPHEAATLVLRDALAAKCSRVLEDAGVFKLTSSGNDALYRYLAQAGVRLA